MLFFTFVDCCCFCSCCCCCCCCCCWVSFRSSRGQAELAGLLPVCELWPWVVWLASWALAAAESKLLAGKEVGCGGRL